jgi:regulatory protein
VAGWVEAAVARLVKSGAVDDRRYALDRAASLRRLGKSPGKIRALLTAKGVDRALVAEALEATSETDAGGDAALAAAIAYARRRRLGPFGVQDGDKDARRKKAVKDLSALGRAGFSYAIAKRIVTAATAEDLLMVDAA